MPENEKPVVDAVGHTLSVGDDVCGAFLHGNKHRVRAIRAIGPQNDTERARLRYLGDRASQCLRVEGGWIAADKARKVLRPGHVEVEQTHLDSLNHDAHWLSQLEMAGVDNWDGYGFAQEQLETSPCPCAACEGEDL